MLFAICYRILWDNRHLAEDALQEAFLKIFQYAKFEEFKTNPEAFRPYALVICRNVARGYLEHLSRDPRVTKEANLESMTSATTIDPELYALRSKLLQEVLVRANEDDRTLLNLLLMGYTIKEIADRLSLSYTNTAVKIHRLWAHIANSLK
jgi:RNA polymerase sigma factor (sigma-70 family)